MGFHFREARRESIPVIIGLAGGTGSGKTYSAFKLAQGISGGKKFAVIDTERRRALHYADDFKFDHAELGAPFRPDRYTEAIEAADKAGYPVIIVDSASHAWAGDGGVLDWHEELLEKFAGNDYKKREANGPRAWIEPKASHKRMVQRMLQLNAHLILCFRAEPKIEIAKENGKTVIRPKQSVVGVDGWMPICEKNLPFELMASFLFKAENPGVAIPIKLQEQHRKFFPEGKKIDSSCGEALARWAAGGANKPTEELSVADRMRRATTMAELNELAKEAKGCTGADQEAARAAYKVAKASLEDQARAANNRGKGEV